MDVVRLILTILSLIASTVHSQSCSDSGLGACLFLVIGDPTTALCPTGTTCLTNLANPICCTDSMIVYTTTTTTTTASPTTTTTASTVIDTCVDLINPITGVSDCPARRYLCNDNTYYNVMTQQCPRTCGRCTSSSVTGVTSTCADQLNPATGISDCPDRISFCNVRAYYNLMTIQCPLTCSRCTTIIAQPTGCADLLNPATGVSDCPARAYLCNSAMYTSLMTIQCPRTCGRCTTYG